MNYIKIAGLAALIAAGCLCGLTVEAKDVNSNAGTSAFPFLKINVGARAVAMGGAFTGAANDESALYYNPAGITSFEDKRFILEYHNYVVDLQSGVVGYISPIGYDRFFGVYASYLNYGDFVETDADGNTLGEFSGGDMLMGVSFAMKRGYNWSFGATGKFIYEKIQDFSATGIALDLGAKYTSDRDRLGLGFAVQNLGFQLSSLGDERDKLPLTFRGGVSYKPRGLKLLLAGDAILPIDNDPIAAIGIEYFELKPFYMRAGWNSFGSNFRSAESDDKWAGFSVGVGFDIKRMQISYAYSPAAELGESHRITLTGGF